MNADKNYNFQVLYAGCFDGSDCYGVYRVANGRTVSVGSLTANVAAANARCKELGERDGVRWFGR